MMENNIDKWTRKFMKIAKVIAEDNQACHSRKIGVVIVSNDNRLISMGYNGSVEGAPHNDSEQYLAHLWANLLNEDQKIKAVAKHNLDNVIIENSCHLDRATCDGYGEDFVRKFTNCGTCPRRLLDLPSGVGLEYCNCSHAERNAIFNAARKGIATEGAKIICWCGVPCHDCSIAIVQAGIKKVYCLETTGPDYSVSSRGIFQMAGVELNRINPELI